MALYTIQPEQARYIYSGCDCNVSAVSYPVSRLLCKLRDTSGLRYRCHVKDIVNIDVFD